VSARGVVAGRLRAAWLRLRGARVGPKASVGRRLACAHPRGLSLGERVTLDDDVRVLLVGGDARMTVGAFTFVGAATKFDVHSTLSVGEHVLFGPGCFVTDHDHGLDASRRIDEQPCEVAPVSIGSDVWVGAHAVVLKGVRIGDGAVVAAGSVVREDVAPGAVVAGVPARPVGARR
jgi:acetyltransferase-like isoleucine patch superfamily enzyme